jgi:adenosine deaminase
MLEDWNKHNVIYLEIRTSLKEKAEIFTKEEYLKAVLEEINNFNNEKKMITRLIISLDREKELNDYEETYNIYKNLNDENLKKLIVGIDYSGNEINEKHKYEELIPYLEKFRNEGLKITIHMGENPNYQIFPFDKFIPDRVSHCYFLKEEHYLEILKRNIHIEVCPTCSYNISHQTDFSKIPLRNFWNKKIVDINGNERETDLPTSNVLYYELENNSWCCVRPSGTEPKIKFYMGVKGSTKDDANAKLDELTNAMKSFVE